MNRKVLTFITEAGEKQRVYFRDGICRTPATLDMVLQGGYSWEGIKTSGNTEPAQHLKFKSRKSYEPVVIPPQFAGQQNPPKAVAKEPVLDSEGKAIPKVVRNKVTPELITNLRRLAGEGKTLKEAEAELSVGYSTLLKTAKVNEINFQRKLRASKALPVDPALLDNMKRCAGEGKTLKETETALNIPYAKLSLLARKNSIAFKAGKKGKQASGIKKELDPVLVSKVKALCEAGKTVSETTKELNVPWFEIVKVAKQENLTFVKGKRGKRKAIDNAPVAVV